jgi:class 3 adenylate cyclase
VRGSTRYTEVGDAVVAYQVIGDGPIDVVYLTGLFSNIDLQWDVPPWAHVLERLASFSRLIMFDRRGVGVSDPVPPETLGSWERWVEDLLAVLEATSSARPAILAEVDATPVAQLFAATHPDRVRALAMWNPFARITQTADYAMGMSDDTNAAVVEGLRATWGSIALAEAVTPERQRTPALLEAIAKLHRGAATPTAARAMLTFQKAMDTRDVLGSIRVPTLVLAREEWDMVPVDLCRFVAEGIEHARLLTFRGHTPNLWGDDDADEIVDAIETFLTGAAPTRPTDRVLATVVFTDIVSSTERAAFVGDRAWKALLDTHDEVVSKGVARFRGSLVKSTGDGALATFDGPARAIGFAFALKPALAEHGLAIRVGIHCGEVELRGRGDIGGMAVHIAARCAAAARPDEVLCSRTVRDLTVGSTATFEDRGLHELKGVPDLWQLYTVGEG